MKIEKAIMLKTLKAGKTVWEKGTVLSAPVPADIVVEVQKDTGTVEVLEQGRDIQSKPVPVPKEKFKKATTTTTIRAIAQVEEKEKPKLKPKLKLKLRKKK